MKYLTIDGQTLLHNPWIPKVACGFFLLLFAREIFYFSGGTDSSPVEALPARVALTTTNQQQILEAPLFGVYRAESDTISEAYDLHFEISGILYAPKASQSQVLVREEGGEERSYQVGESLPGNLVIQRILQDGIVILHRGKLERLGFPKAQLHFEPLAQPLTGEKF